MYRTMRGAVSGAGADAARARRDHSDWLTLSEWLKMGDGPGMSPIYVSFSKKGKYETYRKNSISLAKIIFSSLKNAKNETERTKNVI